MDKLTYNHNNNGRKKKIIYVSIHRDTAVQKSVIMGLLTLVGISSNLGYYKRKCANWDALVMMI